MEYYALTDSLRDGDVIMADGRRFYRFVFGTFQWERTTILLPYLTQGTPFYEKFRIVGEDEAQELLLKKGKKLQTLLGRAEAMAKSALESRVTPEGKPELEWVLEVSVALTDMEERIVFLLYRAAECTCWDAERMLQEGFLPPIRRAVEILISKAGISTEAYLTQVRKNRISRNVLLMELSSRMNQAGEAEEQIRRARQFLYGDIPSFSGEMTMKDGPVSQNLVPAMKIYQQANRLAFEGRKIVHGISNPVLRMQDGNLYLAFFAYVYTRQNLQEKKIPRPSLWLLTDLTTGNLVRRISCSEEDFSPRSHEELCSTENPNAVSVDYQKVYGMLDSVRQQFLEGGTLNREMYNGYLEQILQAVPPSYHCFYKDLTNV